jgi:hypothetical protein
METVDPKEFTSRMSRVATINADDFRPMDYGKPWDGELYWGMFLWELGLLDREPKRQYIPELHLQFGTDDENPNFNEHHWGLYDRDWQKVQTIRSVQVVPVQPVSARGMAYLDRGIFKPESWERIVNHLLEVPGTKRVSVSLANVAEAVVEALLESDPKDLAMRATASLPPDTMIVFQCPFTDVGQGAPVPHVARPNYYSDEVGDWQRDWNQASQFKLGDYIHDGVLDLNELPFGCESIILVNPDGSPGAEFSIEDLNMGTAEVIDTYVSPDRDNEDDRDLNPEAYYPRAARRAAPGQDDPQYREDMDAWNPPDA